MQVITGTSMINSRKVKNTWAFAEIPFEINLSSC